jgi:hypothetical protein
MNRWTKSRGSWHFLRREFFALAAVALGVLLFQPICDAHEFDAGDPATCCESMADAAALTVVVPAVSAAGQLVPGVAIAPASTPRPIAARILAAAPRGHPPACLPYHVRSSRNLS